VKINEQENVAKTLEQKNTALLADLKYMRIENEKLQARLRETQQQVMAGDAQHGQVTQEMQAQVSLMEEVKRKILDAETALRTKSMRISELEAELLSAESNTYAKIKSLQEGLSKVKAEAMQTQAVFASQISALK
jgi:predicted RNase H-like nuclease (RuvC/YqgF family)